MKIELKTGSISGYQVFYNFLHKEKNEIGG